MQLLLVDDETSVVDTLADTIPWHQLGVTVVHKAYSGFEAIEILENAAVNIVITDIRMPGMSGLELIQTIRSKWKKTKCMLLSGYAEFSYAQKAIELNTLEYLIKPISDEELIEKLRKVITEVRREWEEVASYQKAMQAFRENLPLLREKMLLNVLSGKSRDWGRNFEHAGLLNINFKPELRFAVLLIRLEQRFNRFDDFDCSLMEYSVRNIAEELLSEHFSLWFCKDHYDYLVFLVGYNEQAIDGSAFAAEQKRLEKLSVQLQENVQFYLKGDISVVISRTGCFPEDAYLLYQDALLAIRNRIGNDSGMFLSLTGEPDSIVALKKLYEPPLLIHLLEAGRWEASFEKLAAIFEELDHSWQESQEHLQEVFFALSATFVYIAHRNGKRLMDLIGLHYGKLEEKRPFRTHAQLREWALNVIDEIKKQADDEKRDMHDLVVDEVKAFILQHLSEDVSLQTIADHVHLHPVYVSKIFKLITGENVSEYLYQLRMEKAAHLLKHTNDKIYEITFQLGYNNPPYFIKVFKKHYGLTPQEYRDGSG
ncbi:response regulator [Paenibacillus thalictri]|uniref:Response regulator n=1 Tax=Paenibacillus thalictri TaxID=2527873 RepID=A0A4Q9DS22_9BACL|nr:response regulator [Paenibacillus thalictri]TBL76534.1 response regulator [Paenibacillus thalictri]